MPSIFSQRPGNCGARIPTQPSILSLTSSFNNPKEKQQNMKQKFGVLGLLAALSLIACVTGAAFAQEADTMPAHPMFERLKPVLR